MKSTATLLWGVPPASRSSIETCVEYGVRSPEMVAPVVSQLYSPVCGSMLAPFVAKGGPGWMNPKLPPASAGVERRNWRVSPSGSMAGTVKTQRPLGGQRTSGGRVLCGELLPLPTFTSVSMRYSKGLLIWSKVRQQASITAVKLPAVA